jgi:hypothetical protein
MVRRRVLKGKRTVNSRMGNNYTHRGELDCVIFMCNFLLRHLNLQNLTGT